METTVVGGGLAGLIAAIELAMRGSRVTLFEQGRELGGRICTIFVMRNPEKLPPAG